MAEAPATDDRDRVLAGIAITCLAYFLFSANDAVIKLLVAGIAVWQVMFFRAVVILSGCVLIGGPGIIRDAFSSSIVRAMFLRSFLILTAWLCFYTAARDLQLAELTTIYFAAPLIITIMAIPMLGERVTPIRWIAVITGFGGVFVASNPAHLGISVPVLLVLAAAFLWSLSIVLLRMIAMRERTLIQLVLNNAFFIVTAGVVVPFVWRMPDAGELALLISAGAIGGCAQFCLFEGMRRAPVSILAPFEYSSLIWAFGLGYLIWGDIPRAAVWIGALLIVSAGAIIILGERRQRI